MDNHSFTNLASFGKRIEHFLIGQMLKEGLDVYLPVVDDKGIDAVVRRPDGSFAPEKQKTDTDQLENREMAEDVEEIFEEDTEFSNDDEALAAMEFYDTPDDME